MTAVEMRVAAPSWAKPLTTIFGANMILTKSHRWSWWIFKAMKPMRMVNAKEAMTPVREKWHAPFPAKMLTLGSLKR